MNVSLFCDSGAHSFHNKNTKREANKHTFSFYESDEFWKFIDDYADFLKVNKELIETYVTVDVIFNPELSWKTQKYLKKKKYF
jgi:hypothetical protein